MKARGEVKGRTDHYCGQEVIERQINIVLDLLCCFIFTENAI